MIVRVGKGGRSFKGAHLYYGHDKEASTTHRLAWTHCVNMITDDPEKAWKVMAYTAMSHERLKEASGQKATGRKLQKPVFDLVLFWHPTEKPTRQHKREMALKALAALGLGEHEAVFYVHKDRVHPHVHIMVNRVHPLTGLAANMSNSKRKLSDFAHAYEQDNGKIFCLQRERNFQKRKSGERTVYGDPNIVSAWQETNDGKGFAGALQKRGYLLAQGRKRIVVIDPHGRVHNPARHLKDVRAKDIRAKLGDFNFAGLPDAAKLSEQIQQKDREKYQETEKVRIVITAAIINRLQDRHIEERATMAERHHRRILRERDRLTEYYKIEERRKEIIELTQKIKQPSVWRTLTGTAAGERDDLTAMKENLKNVQERLKEKMDFLELDRDRSMTALAERHAKEKELLMERGPDAAQKPTELNQERGREKGRDYDFDR